MPGESTHLQIIPAANHPKYKKIAVTDIREKSVDFFSTTTWEFTLAPTIILHT